MKKSKFRIKTKECPYCGGVMELLPIGVAIERPDDYHLLIAAVNVNAEHKWFCKNCIMCESAGNKDFYFKYCENDIINK